MPREQKMLHSLHRQEIIVINRFLKHQEKFDHSEPPPKAGKTNLLWPVSWLPYHPVIVGKKANGTNDEENQNVGKENISVAFPAECRQLRDKDNSSTEEGHGSAQQWKGRVLIFINVKS